MIQLKPSPTKSNLDKKNKSAPINSRVSPWLARLLYFIGCRIVMPLFFSQIMITGQENIPLSDPVIVAPTHRSRWDALIVPFAVGKVASGRDLRFMVSANEVKGLQGWFIRRMGGFPVNTERPDMSCVSHSIELLQHDQEMLVVFPEGGIFRDNQVHSLKRGVARIALEVETANINSKVKILPVTIEYSQPYPNWGTEVKVNIGSPLNVADYLSNSLRQSSRKLTKELEIRLQRLYQRTTNI